MSKESSALKGVLVIIAICFMIPIIGSILAMLNPVIIFLILAAILFSKSGGDSFKGFKNPQQAKFISLLFVLFIIFVAIRFAAAAKFMFVILIVMLVVYATNNMASKK